MKIDRQQIVTEIFESISSLGRSMMNKGQNALPEGMPTRAQMGVLFLISHHSPQSIKQIAEKFQITSSAATQLVNGLVKDKLLKRSEDEADRRKIGVELTEKGNEKMKMAEKMRFEKMKKMFDTLTDEELSQLKDIYMKISDRLKNYE